MFIAQTLSVLDSAFLGFVVKEGGSIATSPNFTLSETRNWLKARLTVYPPQCVNRNPVNFQKIFFQH